jgi:hypothetical protein
MYPSAINHWHALLQAGVSCAVDVRSGNAITSQAITADKVRRVLFPGAFNPLHAGHRKMADIGEEILEATVEFEISITNVDKPPLAPLEIQRRLQQFPPTQSVWLTNAMRFTEKAAMFPQTTFLVGTDTIARLADAAYHNECKAELQTAIQSIKHCGCRFLVFGRTFDGEFRSLASLDLPPALVDICAEVPGERFHVDMSSTQLRIAEQD